MVVQLFYQQDEGNGQQEEAKTEKTEMETSKIPEEKPEPSQVA